MAELPSTLAAVYDAITDLVTPLDDAVSYWRDFPQQRDQIGRRAPLA